MVMNLPPPPMSSLDLVDAVVAERQGGVNAAFFANIRDEWRDKVRVYIDRHGSPEHVRPWPEIEPRRTTFLNLYTSPVGGSVQGGMLAILRNHELNLCPACGEAGSPNTLDHYLPKRQYPHFAITPLNLFPMCDACQLAKGEKTGDAAAPRYFIHPYFDTFSIPQVVTLSFVPPFVAPDFDLEPHPNLTLPERTLVVTHLRELEIIRRYSRFFRDEYRRLLRLVDEMRLSGQNVVQTLTSFKFRAELQTPNSWEHVFYQGALSDPELVNFLVAGDLPQFL